MATQPPAVNNQQPTNGACATCPKAATMPCDVDDLAVKVEYKLGEQNVSGVVTTDRVKRTPIVRVPSGRSGRGVGIVKLPYPKLSYAINARLAQYDIVIEALADYPQAKTVTELPAILRGDDKSAKNKASIKVSAKFSGLSCDLHKHGEVRIRAKNRKEQISTKVNKADHDVSPVPEFASPSVPILDGPYAEEGGGKTLGGALFLFDFLAGLFQAMSSNDVEIIAEACGARASGDKKKANTELRALVRVCRPDKWSLTLKIPALGTFKQEKETKKGILTGTTETSTTNESRVGADSKSKTSKTTTEKSGTTTVENTSETWNKGKGSKVESKKTTTPTTSGSEHVKLESTSTHSDNDGSRVTYDRLGAIRGRPIREQVPDRLKAESKFDLELKRNDKAVPIQATLKKIKEGVEAFGKVIGGIQDAFKKAPQLGWKFTFEISAFAGSVGLELAPGPGEKVADGRYLPIKWTCTGNIEIELINLKITASFGIDASVLDSGLVIKVEGSMAVSVAISTTVNLDSIQSPSKEFGIKATNTNELQIVGYVSLTGRTIAEAKLSIGAGFEFKDGKLVIDVLEPTCKLTGELAATGVTVTGKIHVGRWWDNEIDPPLVLLSRVPLHTFK